MDLVDGVMKMQEGILEDNSRRYMLVDGEGFLFLPENQISHFPIL